MLSRSRHKPGLAALIAVLLAKTVFYAYALLWLAARRATKVRDLGEVVSVFYLDFLRLRRAHVKVVRLSKCEAVVRCSNPCPILDLSLRLSLDTRFVCRIVSEPVCRFVLARLDPRLELERDYAKIRPYAGYCEERVYLRDCSEGSA